MDKKILLNEKKVVTKSNLNKSVLLDYKYRQERTLSSKTGIPINTNVPKDVTIENYYGQGNDAASYAIYSINKVLDNIHLLSNGELPSSWPIFDGAIYYDDVITDGERNVCNLDYMRQFINYLNSDVFSMEQNIEDLTISSKNVIALQSYYPLLTSHWLDNFLYFIKEILIKDELKGYCVDYSENGSIGDLIKKYSNDTFMGYFKSYDNCCASDINLVITTRLDFESIVKVLNPVHAYNKCHHHQIPIVFIGDLVNVDPLFFRTIDEDGVKIDNCDGINEYMLFHHNLSDNTGVYIIH